MTYNIRHGQTNSACTQPPAPPGQPPAADCNLDLSAAVEVLRAHDADLIGVQEVDRFWARSAYRDQAALLAAALRLKHQCYAANLDHAPDSHASVAHQYGTLILSRFPILECGNTPLRRTGDNEPRGLTRALVDVRGVPLQLYHTHLHTTAADRLLQAADIASAIDAARDGPKVLMGDFNADPGAAEMLPIGARLVDAWVKAPAANPENPSGSTAPALLSGHPARRIDYIFVSADVEVSLCRVPIDAGTRVASDHYPVVSDVSLPGP
jgi:endonuclease/exonuclease/phosphatase family metal-dependent hydrolase